MRSPTAEAQAAEDEAWRPPAGRSGPAAAHIHPLTGLSTDYLNHFYEAVMLLELLPAAPECRADLAAWRPRSYREHFAGSQLSQREIALAAYERLDAALRRRFESLCAAMNAAVLQAQHGVACGHPAALQQRVAAEAAAALRDLIADANAAIQGCTMRDGAPLRAPQESAGMTGATPPRRE